ncbi:MAG: hypothetical protein ACPHL3_07330, partial [Paracoccaceae bacterium]
TRGSPAQTPDRMASQLDFRLVIVSSQLVIPWKRNTDLKIHLTERLQDDRTNLIQRDLTGYVLVAKKLITRVNL